MHTKPSEENKYVNWCLEIRWSSKLACNLVALTLPYYLRAASAIVDTVHRNDHCKRGHMGLYKRRKLFLTIL